MFDDELLPQPAMSASVAIASTARRPRRVVFPAMMRRQIISSATRSGHAPAIRGAQLCLKPAASRVPAECPPPSAAAFGQPDDVVKIVIEAVTGAVPETAVSGAVKHGICVCERLVTVNETVPV